MQTQRFTFPIGEHPHASYSVSTTDFVLLPSPLSTLITRPNPSNVVFSQRPFVVAVFVGGEFV